MPIFLIVYEYDYDPISPIKSIFGPYESADEAEKALFSGQMCARFRGDKAHIFDLSARIIVKTFT